MDFYGMKRKILQSLCKKHGIPANLKNTEMADRLTLIFKEKENSMSCQLGSDIVGTEKGTFDCVSSKEMLKVETLELDSNNVEEVHLSSLKSLDGTSDQVLPTDPPSEMKSSDLNIHQMGASGTAAGNTDDCEVKSVSSQKISLSAEERADFPPKHLENSQIKPKTNLSPKRGNTGCFYVEENLQMSVNEEQVDDNQILHAAEPTGAVVMKDVAPEKFGNYLVEGKFEKLGDKIDVKGDICGTRKVGAECEKQDHTNGPQGSNINCENPSHVSPKEFSGHLVEGEVHKLDDSIYVLGAVNDDRSDTYEAAPMCLDASIGAMDTDGKTNVTVEQILDGTQVQFLLTYPSSETKVCDVDIHKMVVPGTAIRSADACEGRFVSSQKISPASEKMIGFSPKLLNNSDTPRDDIGICVVEENMQIGVNKDQIDHSQEVLHAAPGLMVMKNEDLLQVALEESVNHLEGEVEKLGDKLNPLEDVCETRKDRDEAVKQGGINSPQGSNINDVHLLHVTSEESGYPLVEGEVHKCEADTTCLGKDTNEKTKVTAEHFQEEVYSSSLKSSDGTPNQFLLTYPLSEVKSSDLNIHQIVASGTAIGNADDCKAKFVSSEKTSLSPEERIDFPPKLMENSQIKRLESETKFSPKRDDAEYFYVEENLQMKVNREQVEYNQELHAAAPTGAVVMKDAGYVTVEHILHEVHLSTFAGYKDHVDHNQEVLHPVPTVVLVNTEDYGFFEEGEFEDLGDNIDLLEDVFGTGKGRDEAVNQGGIHSPQGSNINDVNLLHGSPEESSYRLVEEVQKSDNNDFQDGVYNLGNSGSEVDAMCLLDSSIVAKDTDRKTNVTMEHLPYDVHSSTPDQFLATHPPSEVMSSDLNINQMVASDTCEEMLKSAQKTGLIADPEECIGFSPKNLEASVTKGFEAEPYCDPSTLGDVVGTCNMKESMQSDKMEKENGQEEYSLVQGEDIHDDTRTVPTGAEDENQPYMVSHKRKTRDMDSLEPSMMNKKLEIETNLPLKTTRDVGTCDMKENIKLDKKEQVGMIIPKNTFPKRQPLQDLRQN